jgi:transcriptional regulator with XRE-family HTH domain
LLIAGRINSIRKKLDLNQEELAAILNVSQPAISKYLQNRIPPPRVLLNLAILGNTTVEWILTGRHFYFTAHGNLVKEKTVVKYKSDYELSRALSSLPQEVYLTLQTLISQLELIGRDQSSN